MPRDIREDNTTTPTDPVMEIVADNTAHEEFEHLHEEHNNTSILSTEEINAAHDDMENLHEDVDNTT